MKVLVGMAGVAVAGLVAAGAGAADTHRVTSTMQKQAAVQGTRVYSRTVTDPSGYRYRIIVKMKRGWVLPRVLGPPGWLVFGDPGAFSVTIRNLTPGREAPLFGGGGFRARAVWRLPNSLARDKLPLSYLEDSSGHPYINLDANYPPTYNEGNPNLRAVSIHLFLRPGATITLQAQPLQVLGGSATYADTFYLPERRYRAYRALSIKSPDYVLFTSPGAALGRDFECDNVIAAWRGAGAAIPVGPKSVETSPACKLVSPFAP